MAVSRIDEAGLNVTQYGNRNLIINGAATVAQRGTSETGVTSTGYYTVDRFKIRHDGSSTSTIEQVSDAPEGFNNSFKLTTTTAGSIGSTDSLRLDYHVESQDLQGLKFGTANASTFTISFWVKSSIAGDYCLNVYMADGSQQVNDTYTINSANTWEYKSITFVGNTGTAPANDSSSGFEIGWFMAKGSSLGTGSQLTTWTAYNNTNYGVGQNVDISGTLNATWQITGVQLEVGGTATPFEHRSYADELLRCKRYFTTVTESGIRYPIIRDNNTTVGTALFPLSVPLRASPTLDGTLSKAGTLTGSSYGSDTTPSVRTFEADNNCITLYASGTTAVTSEATVLLTDNADPLTMDAEL